VIEFGTGLRISIRSVDRGDEHAVNRRLRRCRRGARPASSISNPWNLYCFVAVVSLFGFLVVQRAVNSPFGEILKAIHENEPGAVSLGYRALQYKLAAFVLSAVIAGLAGATKALVVQNASLTDVSFSTSGEVVLMTLVGGMARSVARWSALSSSSRCRIILPSSASG
jgi:ABC-type branched-subunit amino acid transport system permease subunit